MLLLACKRWAQLYIIDSCTTEFEYYTHYYYLLTQINKFSEVFAGCFFFIFFIFCVEFIGKWISIFVCSEERIIDNHAIKRREDMVGILYILLSDSPNYNNKKTNRLMHF